MDSLVRAIWLLKYSERNGITYLKVTVWELIRETCKQANIKIPSIKEFIELLDDKTFEIYSKGLTSTINQADSDWATNLIKAYKPKTLAEMSAFVAAIRPGFASLLDNFIKRKSYTTSVDSLDELLEDSYHYMMYQESIMKYLIWLGIDEPSSYDVIKKIAKKKFKEAELKELHSKLEKGWINNVGTLDGFQETWQVVEDASRYSFNASHSLAYAFDSLYGAYLKSHYPLEYYTVALNLYNGDMPRTTRLTSELDHFNIKLNPPKFRYSQGEYSFDRNTNSIYKGIGSIKYLNETIGKELYSRRNNQYEDFIELLVDLVENSSANSRAIEILIKLGFFDEFGKSKLLLDIYEFFQKKYKKTYVDKTKALRLTEIREHMLTLNNVELPISDIITSQLEYVGVIDYKNKDYDPSIVLITEIKVNKFGTPFFTIYRLCDGVSASIKVEKETYKNSGTKLYDAIQILEIKQKPKVYKDKDGKWANSSEKECILSIYRRVI